MVIFWESCIGEKERLWFWSRYFCISRMFNLDLLRLSFVLNFHYEVMSTIQSNIFLVLQNKIVEWTPREMFVFLLLINSCLLMFYVTKHISNHIIKHSQYFVFFIWIVSINISVTIVNIIWVFNSFCKDVQELETNFVLFFHILSCIIIKVNYFHILLYSNI